MILGALWLGAPALVAQVANPATEAARPLPQAHLDMVPLAGLNDDAPRAKGILIFGWEL